MNRGFLIQIACLYAPIISSALLLMFVQPTKRHWIGLLYSFLWVAALLPWLDLMAVHHRAWSYHTQSIRFGSIPLSLYLGWSVAWGITAPLLCSAIGNKPWFTIILFLILDLRLMPELTPLLQLENHWYLFELFATVTLLAPSVFIYKWTIEKRHLAIRCAMLAPTTGGILLGFPIVYTTNTFSALLQLWLNFSPLTRCIWTLAFAIFTLLGLTALRDLTSAGKGTPVPLEPPVKLVTHGTYAYLRNPMQLSMTALLVLVAILIDSPWPAVLALTGMVYCMGLARWSEATDMKNRFGSQWTRYAHALPVWLPRWRPTFQTTCQLQFSDHNPTHQTFIKWLSYRNPSSLQITKIPLNGPACLIWHDPKTGRSETNLSALAMSLQHINLPYAIIGWSLILTTFSTRKHQSTAPALANHSSFPPN